MFPDNFAGFARSRMVRTSGALPRGLYPLPGPGAHG